MVQQLRKRFTDIWLHFPEVLWSRKWVVLSAVFFTALFIRLLSIGILGGLERPPNYDEIRYHNFAVRLLNGQGYSTELGPTASKPPLFPFILAGIYFFFGEGNVGSIRISLAVISSLSCILIIFLGRTLGSIRTGFIAGIAAAFYPLSIYMSTQIYPESVFLLLLTGMLISAAVMVENASLRYAFITGVLFGFLVLNRPNILIFAVFILIYPLLDKHSGWFSKASIFGMGTLLIILPWSIRNYFIFNEWVPITTEAGAVFWSDNHPMAAGGTVIPGKDTWAGDDYPDLLWLGWSNLSEVESNSKFMTAGIEWVQSNPGDFLALIPKKIFRLWSPAAFTTHSDRYASPLVNLLWIPYLPFLAICLLGFIVSLKNWRSLWLLYGLIISTVLTTAVFSGGTRYSMPMIPALLIFFGTGLSNLFDRFMIEDLRISL